MSADEALLLDDLAAAAPYSMVVQWSDEDAAYIVSVPELPGCRTHGATRAEAVAMGEEAIAGWLSAARGHGEELPPPRLFVEQEISTPA